MSGISLNPIFPLHSLINKQYKKEKTLLFLYHIEYLTCYRLNKECIWLHQHCRIMEKIAMKYHGRQVVAAGGANFGFLKWACILLTLIQATIIMLLSHGMDPWHFYHRIFMSRRIICLKKKNLGSYWRYSLVYLHVQMERHLLRALLFSVLSTFIRKCQSSL